VTWAQAIARSSGGFADHCCRSRRAPATNGGVTTSREGGGTRDHDRDQPNHGGEDDMAADTTDERYDEARKRVEAKMGFFSHLAVFAVINIVFLIVAGADWLWVTLFWGIGLALHAWQVFFSDSGTMAAWKERQIQKELGRGEPKPQPEPAPAPEPTATATEVPGPSDEPTMG
jgi:hypothetical protein